MGHRRQFYPVPTRGSSAFHHLEEGMQSELTIGGVVASLRVPSQALPSTQALPPTQALPSGEPFPPGKLSSSGGSRPRRTANRMSSPQSPSTGPSAGAPLSIEDLVAYFRSGAKDRTSFRIGIEQEKIAVREDGRPVPYDGAGGLAEVLARLEQRGFEGTREDGHTIALARKGDRITM